jgi:glycosyltransferase involved in cell wall biosynthesis
MIDLSVVIPVRNEEASVRELHRELSDVLVAFGRGYEIIVVDDGSTDRTFQLLAEMQALDPHLRVIQLRRNFGQTAAFAAGFDHARGRYIVTMDGDLQNDPRDIPRVVGLAREHDVVIGRRAQRRDTIWRRAAGKLANSVRRSVLGDGASDTGCSLKLFPTQAFLALPRFDGMHRFLPALFRYQGLSVHEIDVNHRARNAGRSKYTNFARLRRTVFDLAGVYWLSKRTIRVGSREES